ncbi:MAG: mannitol dehydrogenase family protein [Jiangellaceae bacterium]
MSAEPGSTLPRLSRGLGWGRAAAPVRIVHLGIGNFFRAHQAWYTDRAPDADRWGIAAFTGRRPDVAEALTPQNGLYTLVTRHRDGDTFEVISSLSAAHAAAEHDAWLGYLRSSAVAIISLTVTEAGYLRDADGRLDTGRADVQADVAALRADPLAPVTTTPGRLVAGFLARRAAHTGPVTVLPCDNLAGNGAAVAAVVADLTERVDSSLAGWIGANVSYATTMVDRITPKTTDDLRAAVAAHGYLDAAPVPTEPFTEWVITGEFPAGRPHWEEAGARLVPDVDPFEQRKLWLLNGSHSLMAYAGSIRGHQTVDAAIADPTCRGWVEQWWDEATPQLSLPAHDNAEYREALLRRYENPRIQHLLAQIAADGSTKLPVRILPVVRAERAAGRVPKGAALVLAAWLVHLRGRGAPVNDAHIDAVPERAHGPVVDAVPAVLDFLEPGLAQDDHLVAAVLDQVRVLDRP